MLEKIEELQGRMVKTLQRCREVKKSLDTPIRKQSPFAGPSLAGMLGQIGLTSLLTMMETEGKTGVMVVTRLSTTETGCIFLRAGRIIAARIAGQSKRMNEEVIYYLLTWPEGKFEFTPRFVDMEDEIQVPTAYLLLEGVRRLDETARTFSVVAN